MLTNLKNDYASSVQSFHNDEDGMEAIQAVVILAVGAIAMIVVKSKWNEIKKFFDTQVGDGIKGWDGQK